MRALKTFAIAFFLCSFILFCVSDYISHRVSAPWIEADSAEVTVSVNDDRASWKEGIRAGKGGDESLTDRVRLSRIGKMTEDGSVAVTFTVVDDEGQTASLVRSIRFSDYTPPSFTLLQKPQLQSGSSLNLNSMIMVNDLLDGNITHLVKVVSTTLDTNRAGEYDLLLSVETSYGVRAEYVLTVTVI